MNEQRSSVVILASLVSVVIGLGGGFIAGNAYHIVTGTQKTYEQGLAEARRMIDEARILPPEPETVNQLTGTVTAVNDSSVSFSLTGRVIPNPLAPQPAQKRTAQITKDTLVTRETKLSVEEILTQSKAFSAKFASLKPGETPPAPPKTTSSTPIKISDITVGDKITVQSNENIKTVATFTASTVSVQ